jgi:hypothetical protein
LLPSNDRPLSATLRGAGSKISSRKSFERGRHIAQLSSSFSIPIFIRGAFSRD